MSPWMAQRIRLFVLPALTLAACDLAVKATVPAPAEVLHRRSFAWVLLSAVLLGGAVFLVWVPSRAVAAAAGILSGGMLGNLLSARWYDDGVPNPFVVTRGHMIVAFNLADVCILAGILLLVLALTRASIRFRHVLPEQTVAVRLARRLRQRAESRRRARELEAAEARATREAEARALAARVPPLEPFRELSGDAREPRC